MDPTPEQLRIIWHLGGPLLVLAVAGAGKTTALLWLVRRLVTGWRGPYGEYHAALDPAQVLMATFSNRAADDMGERARSLGLPRESFRTLHSVGFELTRTWHRGARQPVVPAKWQLARVARNAIKEAVEDGSLSLDKMPRPGDVLRYIALAKAALIWPEEWCAWNGARFPGFVEWATSKERGALSEGVADLVGRCYAAIERACPDPEAAGFKRDAGARWITFDDQVAVPARAILRQGPDDGWVHYWRGRFAWVLCDEVQDNNLAQWTLCEYLVRDRNLVCVGDDQQAIFEWRGARPTLMRVFLSRHPDAAVLPLTINFRSGPEVLDLANRILEHAKDRIHEGKLQHGRPDIPRAEVSTAEYESVDEEAAGIADEVEEALKGGAKPGSFAILTRINATLGPLELAFIRRQIPYRIAGSSFFARGEVKTAIAYLAVALDEEDEDGFADACNVPARYLGREFLDAFPTYDAARRQTAKLGRWARGFRSFGRALQEVKAILERNDGGLELALQHIFGRVGVREFFRDEDSDEQDATEVDEACLALIQCARNVSDAAELVKFARAMRSTGRESPEEDPHVADAAGRVTLTTVHKAKALEWDRVYVAGLSHGLFPLLRAPRAEERRLFYVAVTRARRAATLSWTKVSAKGNASGPSAFLAEVGLVAQDSVPEEAPTPAQAPAPEPPAEERVDLSTFDPAEF